VVKQKHQLFEFLHMLADLFAVSVCWVASYWLRFRSDFLPPVKGVPRIEDYLVMLIPVCLIWGFVFRSMGLYRPMRGVRRTREILLLVNANGFAILLLIAFVFLFREKDFEFSRLVFLYFWAIVTLGTIAQRSCLRFCLSELRRKGFNLRYLLVVGAGRVAGDVIVRIREHRELGIQLLGCLSLDGEPGGGPEGTPILGSYEDLGNLLKRINVDQLVVALPLQDNHLLPTVMRQIGDSLIDVKIVPDLYQFVSLGGAIEEFEGLPLITVQTSPLEGVGVVVKRAFDLAIGVPVAIVSAPLCLLIAGLIKLTSRGPVLFKQERVSYDGTRFSIYKFRTMRVDAERSGPGWTRPNDDRVTVLGRFLRSTSLDELPQVFNVLRGDMSIVGPRPERPVYIDEFRRRIPRYMLRHKVPAGITGWAQVHGWRGDTSIDRRIEHDLYYIEHWSLYLDIKILVMTVFRGFMNKNAY
jgi:Undecaprenyl-phosphate glucose phosphotransferase